MTILDYKFSSETKILMNYATLDNDQSKDRVTLACDELLIKVYFGCINSFFIVLLIFVQVNAVKFNEYVSVVVSTGYDQSLCLGLPIP